MGDSARVAFLHGPTPIEALDRLAAALGLGAGRLFVKRDDLTPLAGGGNKARKLEWLCGEALGRGCDVLVTGGGVQSNHARATAAAARRLGLDCALALARRAAPAHEGNLLLDGLLGATVEWLETTEFAEIEAGVERLGERLRAQGRKPYVIPVGGSNAVGARGYLEAAAEIAAELPDAVVVTASGTGGTQAGLAAGLGGHGRVVGVSVGALGDLAAVVERLAAETATAAGRPRPTGTPWVEAGFFGTGYGALTDAAGAAMKLAASCEGLVLDPVYTAKAMAGLVALVRGGRLTGERPILFLHTGGLPGLFTGRNAAWLERTSGTAESSRDATG
jgi:D-cysteine desulfhydrase